MKIICAPSDFDFPSAKGDLDIVLYGHATTAAQGSVGAAVRDVIRRQKLNPAPRAWDILSIALAVVTADLAGHRDKSPDGWTREFELHVAVADRAFWSSQAAQLEQMLAFLTTDRWMLRFMDSGLLPAPDREPAMPDDDCVVLLSGGLDSFIGAVDLAAAGMRPFAVSQSVRGDDEKQDKFASIIGGGLHHIRMNHNATVPDPEAMPSQRARSIIFLAYGVMAATTTARYQKGETVTLYVCENGLISVNPPLTNARLGSLSTRTSHPAVLAMFQKVLDTAGLRVKIVNPYQEKTKGEMLIECQDQTLLVANAHRTTSCGRFKRYKYQHCGRCLPCLIRRASFNQWGVSDRTKYVYRTLSRNDKDHARYDDVRAAAMAVEGAKENGVDELLGATLSSSTIPDTSGLKQVVKRGIDELGKFLAVQRVK
jgi:7-cyano-7-deazaguanine synthase in queuosine biosynthesis